MTMASAGIAVAVSTVPVLPLLLLSLLPEGPRADHDALRAPDRQGAGTVVCVAWVTTVLGFGAWGCWSAGWGRRR